MYKGNMETIQKAIYMYIHQYFFIMQCIYNILNDVIPKCAHELNPNNYSQVLWPSTIKGKNYCFENLNPGRWKNLISNSLEWLYLHIFSQVQLSIL